MHVLLGITSFEESSWNYTDVFVMFISPNICFVGRKKLVLKETNKIIKGSCSAVSCNCFLEQIMRVAGLLSFSESSSDSSISLFPYL